MLSIAGFGINEIDAEFRYVTLRAVGKSSRFSRNMSVPAPDAVVLHFRLPQSFGEVLGQLLLPPSLFSQNAFKYRHDMNVMGASMSKVAIVRGTDPPNMVVRALEMVNGAEAISAEKPVLIKPNYVTTSHPSTGITTDSRVIEGVIAFLRQHDVKEIVIGEGAGSGDTLEAFKVAAVDDVAERWKVKTVDLNKDEFIEVYPTKPLALKKVKVAKTALSSTIISVPKLKPHRITGVTLSLKNMMGAVTPKGSMHIRLSQNIVDLASVIRPSLAVIDGIIAGEGHETSGDPVEMNLVIAGADPVAVDSVGAAVMGIPPESVKHLRLAEETGLGTSRLDRIQVLGEPVEKVKRKFRTSLVSKILRI